MAIDLITLEVLRNKFDAIADEIEIALLKSAYSSIAKEGLDAFATPLHDRRITLPIAREHYRVVLEEPTLTVDWEATRRARTTARQQHQH